MVLTSKMLDECLVAYATSDDASSREGALHIIFASTSRVSRTQITHESTPNPPECANSDAGEDSEDSYFVGSDAERCATLC